MLLLKPAQYDWAKLHQEYDWIRNLKDCPQDAIHHAEGDVWIHTRMVVEELLALPAYAQCTAEEQQILFAACLLHDIAKPACTVIEPTGRITSAGHAKMGEGMAREVLMALHLAYPLQEQICKLVRYHGLPLWFLEKQNPEKAIVQASLMLNTRLLAIVAEADARGRICHDKAELLTKNELFRSYCEELQCWGKPREFASPHTRFLYFHKDEPVYPDSPIFDDCYGDVYLMCGIPGAGKDTWIRQNVPDLPMVSLDAIRERLDLDFKDNQGKVLQESQEEAKKYLRAKKSFVWNATNINRQRRQGLIDLFTVYKARVIVVYVHCSLEKALAQNRQREVQIKDNVIARFFAKLEPPTLDEAHQVIIVNAD
ncbi:MAG: HD domain-containing protein [Bacteroidetes bacterium]|nr:MAG: HD domain-containing protein [Bacteroidota bacterium]